MHLVERFTVVRELAAPDPVPPSQPHLQKPVRVGKRLPSGCNDVCVPVLKDGILDKVAIVLCRLSMNDPPTALVGFGKTSRWSFVG